MRRAGSGYRDGELSLPADDEYLDLLFIVERWAGTPSIGEPDKCSELIWVTLTASRLISSTTSGLPPSAHCQRTSSALRVESVEIPPATLPYAGAFSVDERSVGVRDDLVMLAPLDLGRTPTPRRTGSSPSGWAARSCLISARAAGSALTSTARSGGSVTPTNPRPWY